MNETLGLICFILNIFIPGSGTILAGIADKQRIKCPALMVGILQMIFIIAIIGWIWSICHGYHIFLRSKGRY